MIYKEKIVHFIKQTTEQLHITSQTTMHSIQIINVIDALHCNDCNQSIGKAWVKAKCLAISVISLCTKLLEKKSVHMREFVRAVDNKNREYPSDDLDKFSMQSQQKYEQMTNVQIGRQIKQFQEKVVVWLKWRLSMPLLYDEVLTIAKTWNDFTSKLIDFPLSFQLKSDDSQYPIDSNSYLLVNNVRICLYNFNHLLKNTSIDVISSKIRRIALSLFSITVKNILREKMRVNKYFISPKLSVNLLLQDFIRKYGDGLENIWQEGKEVGDMLDQYKLFREKSKGKKIEKDAKIDAKKSHKHSKKQSQDKENIMYYVNRATSKSRKVIQQTDQKSQKYKSRSKSRKEREKIAPNLQKIKLVRTKNNQVLKCKKKSNSTKSIITKNISVIKKMQPSEQLMKKKVVKFNRSRVSKRSELSQINSKINPNPVMNDGQFCSKSTYWLRSTTLAKTDKKSNNSSIRMKIR